MGETSMNAAVAQAPTLPITSAEQARLKWLDNGHMRAMTLYDETIAAEIASGPWTLTGDTTTPVDPTTSAQSLPAVQASTGTCWNGQQNQKTYQGLTGTVTLDAGITGYCDGPGGTAIVARGNYLAGEALNYIDSCNAAARPFFHIQNSNCVGPNPARIDMLNTVYAGNETPFGCQGDGGGNLFASADWVNYRGQYGPYNYIGLGWGQPGWGQVSRFTGPYTCCGTITNN